jgi:hemolysin III
MNNPIQHTEYEERLNTITHGTGFILALFASIFLLAKALEVGGQLRLICYIIYSAGLLTLYLASTLYHKEKNPSRKKRLNIFDHAAIYLLIAGTYTPITLLSIKGLWGLAILLIVWTIALIGIILKLYFTGRYPRISTATYVLLGWVILIAIKPLLNSMLLSGLLWLLAGGLFYTTGAFLYQLKSIKYNHVIFHLFVMAGSICHFMVILYYTI